VNGEVGVPTVGMTAAEFAVAPPPAMSSVPVHEKPHRLELETAPSREWPGIDEAAKRAFDIAAAIVALLLLTPLLLLIALLVWLDSPGPVFYRSTRVGYRGRALRMLKFRKMHDGATGRPLTVEGDERFTSVGRWLSKLKLDELPQLWHVITGEMSLVGPRPESAGFAALHSADYQQILAVRPGIFGWSQLAFAEESRILDAADPLTYYVGQILPQKVSLDTMYARRRTLLIDLRIIAWSVLAVVARVPVAVHRRDGRMRLRRREDG
jgi:lipopolysaccharide/colanic/teichoic acid biosynthesis glycosyltransferase